MKNPNKIIDIVTKLFTFNSQKKFRECHSDLAPVAKAFVRTLVQILTPKQMLQRLQEAFPQVKAGNTSKNLYKQIYFLLSNISY